MRIMNFKCTSSKEDTFNVTVTHNFFSFLFFLLNKLNFPFEADLVSVVVIYMKNHYSRKWESALRSVY